MVTDEARQLDYSKALDIDLRMEAIYGVLARYQNGHYLGPSNHTVRNLEAVELLLTRLVDRLSVDTALRAAKANLAVIDLWRPLVGSIDGPVCAPATGDIPMPTSLRSLAVDG